MGSLAISRFFRMKHVNHQIFLLVILTITIPLMVIAAIIYHYSTQALKDEYQDSSNLILNNLSFNIDQYLQSIAKGTLNVQMNGQLQLALESSALGKTELLDNLQYTTLIEKFVSSIEMTIENVDSVQIFAGGRIYHSGMFQMSDFDATSFPNQEWYRRTLARKGDIAIFGSHMPYHRVTATEPVISIARAINKVGTRDLLGVMLIDIRLDSLKEILSLSESSNRDFMIADQTGGIIYASDPNHPVADRNAYVNFVSSPYSGWKVYQSISEAEMTKNAKLLRQIILGLAFLSLIIAVLFMYILHRRVTKPIILLSKQVKLLGMGRFDVELDTKRQDEFGALYHGVRKMVNDLQNYIERTTITKAQQKVAQYGALKSQINPHFLANALESVQMKAVIGGQREIGEMVGRLGRLFRIHIQSGKETVPLREELAHTRLYVEVQQMRFGEKLRYVEEIADGSESVRMLHFSLQPLIENAIVHGLERISGPGLLKVAAAFDQGDVLIVIRDNGVGMEEERLQSIREDLARASDTLGEAHIGIKNVHERIQYYFGEQYGVRIESESGVGTTVTIRIPALPPPS